MNKYHTSVLLQDTVDLLQVKPGKYYIDATFGGGGHSLKILQLGGKVLGLDADEDAIEHAKKEYGVYIANEQLIVIRENFSNILGIAKENNFHSVAGITYDLGVSSHHIDQAHRGFSFQKEGPLDMRMDNRLQVKASDLVNILTKGELYELFYKLGEERFARTISERIISARRVKPITTTIELAEIIRKSVPRKPNTISPATRVFQALRIAVNDELNNLKESLPQAFELLGISGRLAVISFHSLEDRIVKQQFKEWEVNKLGTILSKKPIQPNYAETEENVRSRSAKLRGFEKS